MAIELVIPMGAASDLNINSCLANLHEDIRVRVVDDTLAGKQAGWGNNRSRVVGFHRLPDIIEGGTTYGPDVFRECEATKLGLQNCTEDIVGVCDEDMVFTAHMDDIDDGHAICDGSFWNRIEALLSEYENLLVFGACYNANPEKTRIDLWTNHPRVVWSTQSRIRHAYNLIQADSAVFMRRDFLAKIGGYPSGVGYGEARRDLCLRAMQAGGVIGMFRDLPYYHMTGMVWRKSMYPEMDPEWFKLNTLRSRIS